MAMDMGAMMKMMAAKNQFEKNHPKFFSFCKAAFGRGVEIDTIFEITVTKPNGETLYKIADWYVKIRRRQHRN